MRHTWWCVLLSACVGAPGPISTPPPAAPECTISAQRTAVTTGESTTLTASCTGEPTEYVWAGVPAPATPTQATTRVGPFATPGTFTFTLVARNAGGSGAPVSAAITVTDTPTVTVPGCTVTATPSSLVVGDTTTLAADCTGSPTQYTWTAETAGAPSAPTGASGVTGAFTAAGMFTWALTATNAAGTSPPVRVTVTVSPAPKVCVPANPAPIGPHPNYTTLLNLRFNLPPGQIGTQAFDFPLLGERSISISGVGATFSETPPGTFAQVAISPCPGDFDVPAPCREFFSHAAGVLNVGDGTGCQLDAGTWHFNIRHVQMNDTTMPSCINPMYGYCTHWIKID